MNRRKSIKTIALSAVIPSVMWKGAALPGTASQAKPIRKPAKASVFKSQWQAWPDMPWTGPEYWGNRLQDWQIRQGKAVCVVSAPNRTLHCLTTQLPDQPATFQTSVTIEPLNSQGAATQYAGFRLGAQGPFPDYRSAAVFGEGLDAGVNAQGRLFIGDEIYEEPVLTKGSIHLQLEATPTPKGYQLRLTGADPTNKQSQVSFTTEAAADRLRGNIALVAHGAEPQASDSPSIAFADWTIQGTLHQDDEQVFGPVCFAQYTLHGGTLKLTAQLTPIETITGHEVALQVRAGKQWRTLQQSPIDAMGRVAQFKVENWKYKDHVPYRIQVNLPLPKGSREYFYEGTIAREPLSADQIKMAVFSCNADYGFPDNEVAPHVLKHKPDLAVFLGDQFYESTGGFGIEKAPLERAALDYLHKWYMFGWSYRDIFRHIPAAFIPDDHDVYHGNVWGEGGKNAPADQGWGYEAQDQGGYKMPPEWVNMMQRTQTSHLPDPYDPTPVKQNIGVYYTAWNYGGISFAILEDRKFKSAPKNVLPEEAKVVNGFIQNPAFNIRAHYDVEADLLGERQMKFLSDWASDWKQSTEMKAVLSQTNFCTVATLPKGEIIDKIVPQLPIPKPGTYVQGDAPTTDMDSNGWPQKGRDQALRTIRKCFAFHIAGDQHLASMVHYGVEAFGDAGFAFAGPALNNLFPRRWWPPVEASHQPLKGKPAYTGNFLDGFGNHMTVHAVANPRQTDKKPARIYDRATGYGMVIFDKKARTIRTECWPRYVDPEDPSTGQQYQGWPVTIAQQDNYSRRPAGHLPTLKIQGAENPVVQVIDEQSGEILYTLRIRGNTFRPSVFAAGAHTVKVSEPDSGREKSVTGLALTTDAKATQVVVL